jgi:hypothetical protein
MRSIVFAAALMATTPSLAQETAPPPPPASDTSAAEAAIEARAEAFEGRIRQMGEEMGAAITAAGPDRAKRAADLDAIQARYQPEADAFASELEAFVLPQLARPWCAPKPSSRRTRRLRRARRPRPSRAGRLTAISLERNRVRADPLFQTREPPP